MPGTANHILGGGGGGGRVQLQQWLHLWQSKSVLVNEPFRPTADDGVEVSLRFQQDSERYGMPVHGS